jgi:hypothetical protein
VQHPRLLTTLLATGERTLIGAATGDHPDTDSGERSALAHVLMTLRTEPREPSFAARRAVQQLPGELAGQPWVLFGHRVVALPRRPTTTQTAVSALHLLRHVAELARQPTMINDLTARWITGLGTLLVLAADPDPDAAVALALEVAGCANVEYVGTGSPPRTRGRQRSAHNMG